MADAVSPVADLQKNLSSAIGDIGRIAEGMQYLPELLVVLADIDKRVSSIQDEMVRMRAGVEDLGELRDLRGAIDDLQRPLAELSSSLHPLQRIGDRLRPGRRAEGEADGAEAQVDPLDDAGAAPEGEQPRGPTPGL